MTIVYSVRQMNMAFAKDNERYSYDFYQILLKQASRVDVWGVKDCSERDSGACGR